MDTFCGFKLLRLQEPQIDIGLDFHIALRYVFQLKTEGNLFAVAYNELIKAKAFLVQHDAGQGVVDQGKGADRRIFIGIKLPILFFSLFSIHHSAVNQLQEVDAAGLVRRQKHALARCELAGGLIIVVRVELEFELILIVAG